MDYLKKKIVASGFYLIFYFATVFFLFWSFPSFALEFPSTIDFYSLGLWKGIRPSKQFHFYMLEDFESGSLWKVQTVNDSAVVRLIDQQPVSQMPQTKEAMTWRDHFYTDLFYATQSAQIDKRPLPATPRYALETMVRVQNPGEENYRLLPPSPKSIRYQKKVFAPIHSRPLHLALWVKGFDRKQSIYALFRLASGKTQRVLLGALDFSGWRRLSTILPYHITNFQKGRDRLPWFWFVGFEITTDKSEAAGFFINIIDQVVIVTDDYFTNYPGYEIKDDWQ